MDGSKRRGGADATSPQRRGYPIAAVTGLLLIASLLWLALSSSAAHVTEEEIQPWPEDTTGPVAFDGTTLVVGETGGNSSVDRSGLVRVLEKNGSGAWVEADVLSASDAQAFADFGRAVDVQGDVIVVGAPDHEVDGADDAGQAYVFEKNASGAWNETARLQSARDLQSNARFGTAVGVGDGRVLVGEPGRNREAFDGSILKRVGAFAEYERNETDAWVLAADGRGLEENDRMGAAVAVSSNGLRTAVGIPGANEVRGDDVGFIEPSDGASGDRFGEAVDVDGDTLVVGAPRDDNELGTDAGSVYIYAERPGGQRSWDESKILEPGGSTGVSFGRTVSTDGTTVAIGRTTLDTAGVEAGGAYLLAATAKGDWIEQATIVPSDAEASDRYGKDVDLAAGKLAGTAPGHEHDGEEGAVYLHGYNLRPVANFGFNPTSITTRDPVRFTDLSVDLDGTVSSWSWDFGDGTTSTTQHPSHTFDAAGAYTVELTATDGHGLTGSVAYTLEIGSPREIITAERTGELVPNGSSEDGDRLGSSVGLAPGLAVAGAPRSELGGLPAAGTAWILEQDGTGAWSTTVELVPPDPEGSARFGTSVAAPNGTAVFVGAPGQDLGSTANVGAVYLYERDDQGDWTLEAELRPSDPTAHISFGEALGVDGDRLVVGADAGLNETGVRTGAAYVFSVDGSGNWIEEAKLLPSDGELRDEFGTSVSISGSTSVVGSNRHETGRGAAYVYEGDSTGSWVEQAKLVAPDREPSDWFGFSVSLDGDRAFVGAPTEDGACPSDISCNSGKGYVFVRDDGGTWSLETELLAEDAARGDWFGADASLDADALLVGGPRRDPTWGENAGTAMLFTHDSDGSWDPYGEILSSNGSRFDRFGHAIALQDWVAFAGAHLDDNTAGADMGTGYVLELDDPPNATFSFAPSDPTTADTIEFTDESTDLDGSIAAWSWDFGDGATSTQQHPTHSYGDDGTYTVTLTVTDDDGDTNTTTQDVTVTNTPPTADFTFDPTEPTTQDTVQFTDESTDSDGSIAAWSWDLGDGTTSTQQDPSHSYADEGTYTVTLTVTDDDGETDTVQQDVTVSSAPPAANFTISPDPALVGSTVQFEDLSTDPDGVPSQWSWDLGDGNTSVVQHPTHTYEAVGTYTVTLTVTDDDGETDTTTSTLDVLEGPPEGEEPAGIQELLDAVPEDSDFAGYRVTLDDGVAVLGVPLDDTAASDAGQALVFEQASDGSWSLAATLEPDGLGSSDLLGVDVAVAGDTVAVGASGDDTLGTNAGAVYIYTRGSDEWTLEQELRPPSAPSGARFGWSLDLDADRLLVGADRSDLHATDAGAAYLYARNESGSWNLSATPAPSPLSDGARFGWSVALDGPLLLVGADRSDRVTTDAGAVHVFARNATGAWTEQHVLTAPDAAAGDAFGSDVDLSHGTVAVGARGKDVSGASEAGAAYLFARDPSGALDLQHQLTSASPSADDRLGEAVSLDGARTLVGEPGHDGAAADEGLVHYLLRDGEGHWTPQATFGAPDAAGGDAFGWSVDLDARAGLTGAYTHTHDGVQSGAGYAFVLTKAPTASFSFEPHQPEGGEEIQFTDESTDVDGSVVAWSWDFGDGATSTAQDPVHAYADDGNYTVTLTVTDDDGATDTETTEIQVSNAAPSAAFSFDPTTPTTLDTVHFTDESEDPDGSIVAWSWDLGDGNTSTASDPEHRYRLGGNYTVCLTVTDDDGADTTRCEILEVHTVTMIGRAAGLIGQLADPQGQTREGNHTDTGRVSTNRSAAADTRTVEGGAGGASVTGVASNVSARLGEVNSTVVVDRVVLPASLVQTRVEIEGLRAWANATCSGAGSTVTLARVLVGGQPLFDAQDAVPPNTTVDLPGAARLVVNEQTTENETVRVNAVHLTGPQGLDVRIGHALARLTGCDPAPTGSSVLEASLASVDEPEKRALSLARPASPVFREQAGGTDRSVGEW